MLQFKQYLKERAPAWTESLSSILFDLPRAGYKDVKIPLSSAIFKRIWPESIRSTVFHLTDYAGVKNLKRMQGKKKSISAFYNLAPDRISYGIQTEGGYIIEMDADVLAAAPDDIGSQPDKTGRRWLTWETILEEMGGGNTIKKMETDLSELLMDLIMKYAEDPGASGMPNINKAWGNLGREYKSDGKGKSLIIKDYIDGMEKIMKKYSRPLRSIFTDYVKKRDLDATVSSKEWDELVVNNFTIKKVHVSQDYADDFEGDDALDMYGLPFKTWDDDGDLTDYITKTVQRIKI